MEDIKLLSELAGGYPESSIKILNLSHELILSSFKDMSFINLCTAIDRYGKIDILFAQRLLDELKINALKLKAREENLFILSEALEILNRLNHKYAVEILNSIDIGLLMKSTGQNLLATYINIVPVTLYRLSQISSDAAKKIYDFIGIENFINYVKMFNSQECLCKQLQYLSKVDHEKTKTLAEYLSLDALFYETNGQPIINIAAILSILKDIDNEKAFALFNKYGAERLLKQAAREYGDVYSDIKEITLDSLIGKIINA